MFEPQPSRASIMIPALLSINFLVIIVLIFAIGLPLLLDYPNYLARYWLLSGGAQIAPVSQMYSIDWRQASTNIGTDLFVLLIGRFVPYTIAGKLVVVGSIVGPAAGGACLNRVIFGRWHWWQFSFVILSWTTTALFGFLSYQLSLALALLFACFDPYIYSSPILKPIIRFAFGVIVLLFHPFGLLFYALLLAALQIGSSWNGIVSLGRLGEVLRYSISLLLVILAPVACLLLLAPAPPGAHVDYGLPLFTFFGSKILTLKSPFLTYKKAIDAIFVVPVLAIYAYSICTGKARTHAGMVIVGLIAASLSLVMPFSIGDAFWTTRRLPLMAALLLFAGVLPDPFRARSMRLGLAAWLFALAIGRTIWVGSVWLSRQQDVRAIENATGLIPSGSSVFVVQSEPNDTRAQPTGRYLVGNPPSEFDAATCACPSGSPKACLHSELVRYSGSAAP